MTEKELTLDAIAKAENIEEALAGMTGDEKSAVLRILLTSMESQMYCGNGFDLRQCTIDCPFQKDCAEKKLSCPQGLLYGLTKAALNGENVNLKPTVNF